MGTPHSAWAPSRPLSVCSWLVTWPATHITIVRIQCDQGISAPLNWKTDLGCQTAWMNANIPLSSVALQSLPWSSRLLATDFYWWGLLIWWSVTWTSTSWPGTICLLEKQTLARSKSEVHNLLQWCLQTESSTVWAVDVLLSDGSVDPCTRQQTLQHVGGSMQQETLK